MDHQIRFEGGGGGGHAGEGIFAEVVAGLGGVVGALDAAAGVADDHDPPGFGDGRRQAVAAGRGRRRPLRQGRLAHQHRICRGL